MRASSRDKLNEAYIGVGMTVRYFEDKTQKSQNGTYRFTARSPENQGEGVFGFQRDFVYTLHKGDQVVWQREQPRGEDSPIRLFVSDEGRCLALVSGLCSDHFLCFSEEGEVQNEITVSADPSREDNLDVVHALTGRDSTGGLLWSFGSFPLFFHHNRDIYFAMSTAWLHPIVIETGIGELIEDVNPNMMEDLKTAQAEQVSRYLSWASSAGHKWLERFPELDGALLLVSQVNFPDKVRRLNTLAKLPDLTWHQMACHSLERGWYVHNQRLTLLLHAVMRMGGLDLSNLGPSYRFIHDRDQVELSLPTTTLPCAKPLPETSKELLGQYGPPHYLKPYSEKKGERLYHWGEHWEYYLTSGEVIEALRITWEPETEGQRVRSQEIVEVNMLERLAKLCIE